MLASPPGARTRSRVQSAVDACAGNSGSINLAACCHGCANWAKIGVTECRFQIAHSFCFEQSRLGYGKVRTRPEGA